MKVDGSLKSLLQGVSQQPARNRLAGQCTAQENMSSNPVDGLTRRAPMEQIANLFTESGAVQFYDYSLGADQDYIVAAGVENLRVFTVDGVEKTVNVTTTSGVPATDYLTGGKLAFTTLDGVTYLANRSIEVAMLSTLPSYVSTGSLVYLLGGQYGRDYTITLTWSGTQIVVTHSTPDGGSSTHIEEIATDVIANALKGLLEANATFAANFVCERYSDIMYIRKTSSPTTQDFEITVSDGDGGTNLLAVNNQIQDAEKVPAKAPQGYVVHVTGSASAGADDWYLQFQAFADSSGSFPSLGGGFGRDGQWVECPAPGEPHLLDNSTMPHILEYDAGTDEFTLSQGAWEGRQVGDSLTNEQPSFVGQTIEDLGYFQGRLSMLSGPSVIMSRTNRPLDFWKESATASSESDPIDIKSTVKGVQKLMRFVPYNRDLVIFADKGQFIVFGRNSLTPTNASLVLTTAFEADLSAYPVGAGKIILFGIKYGKYAGIQEFYTQDAVDANDSRPITQHVLKYLKGTAIQIAASSNFDSVLVRTDFDPKVVYLYEYIWVDGRKAQSSWSKWTLPLDVVHMYWSQSVVYVIVKSGTSYLLHKIDLDVQEDEGLGYQVKLDRKKIVTGVTTTISMPYSPAPDPEDVVFVQGDGCPYPGLLVQATYAAGTYTLSKDMEGGDVICGVRYRSSYIPTMPNVRDQENIKIGTGRLLISKFLVNFRQTGALYYRIFSRYSEDILGSFTGRIVGDPNSVIGQQPIIDGTLVVPFRHDADYAELELYTDSHLPMTFMDIEWKGQYTKKGQRISTGGGQ